MWEIHRVLACSSTRILDGNHSSRLYFSPPPCIRVPTLRRHGRQQQHGASWPRSAYRTFESFTGRAWSVALWCGGGRGLESSSSTSEHVASAQNRSCYCCCSCGRPFSLFLFVVDAAASYLLRVLSLDSSVGNAVYSATATAAAALFFAVATTESLLRLLPTIACSSRILLFFGLSSSVSFVSFFFACRASPLRCPLRHEGFICIQNQF